MSNPMFTAYHKPSNRSRASNTG